MRNQFAPLPLHCRQWVAPLGWTVASVAALGAMLLPTSPAVSTWLWVAFFLIAGTLCSSAYVRRCSRLHCYMTGPVFCKGKVGQFLTETFTKEHIDKNEPIPEK